MNEFDRRDILELGSLEKRRTFRMFGVDMTRLRGKIRGAQGKEPVPSLEEKDSYMEGYYDGLENYEESF